MDRPQVAVVTGGGRGIGAATARLLAQRGHAVCINSAHREDEAAVVADAIVRDGGRAIAVRADVSDPADVARLFATAKAQLGSVTSLVNNAGITGRAAGIDALDADSLRRVFDVNVLGTLLCVREAVKQMAPRHGGAGGAVVNLSSVASQTGGAGMLVGYAASKGAVNTLTLGLARELAVDGIRVNAVMPGIVETAIHEQAGVGARMPALLAMVPMQRIGQPEECAEAIAWLLSAAASYTTGAVLPITGGR